MNSLLLKSLLSSKCKAPLFKQTLKGIKGTFCCSACHYAEELKKLLDSHYLCSEMFASDSFGCMINRPSAFEPGVCHQLFQTAV